ncbi:MAG: right-handed parallel beta-helix repeat-containing protein [Bacteroidales bacterium]|nr:right-handed parallel beta-helix repeat-containing protein [Bacteroidales bacterium]
MNRSLIFLVFLFIIGCSTQNEFYVSPSGNDLGKGTKNKPFKTIQQAQKTVRGILRKGQKNDITVWLEKGTYLLTESLIFGQEDSGQDGFKIRYKASDTERPVLSGGMEINLWKKNDKGIWVAEVPDFGGQVFRELFVNGSRATRARHPNSDFLRIASAGADRRTNFRFNPGDFPKPDDPGKVELVVLHDWSISRVTVADINFDDNKITAVDSIGAKCLDFFNLDHWEKNPRYFLENSLAFLDSAYEWYFDSGKRLLYLMLPEGQNPENLKIVAPVTGPHLVEIIGTEQEKVKNITFDGIAFQYCSWLLPGKGYAGIQACSFDPPDGKGEWRVVPAAVNLKWAANCEFTGCDFLHLGGSGLWFATGCTNCKAENSHFEDISGNGIMVGEGNDRIEHNDLWWKTVPDQVATGNMVLNNVVIQCGKQFFGAVGIWCGLTVGTTISENQVHNLPYTGISVGWEWSPVPTPCRENKLTRNHIHHIMEILSDGGGIYMLGLQPQSVISDNLIHHVKINAGRAESNGMFLDEGTTDVVISGNIIYNIAKSPLRFHKATNNLVKDNILSCGEATPPVRYNSTPEEYIKLENNQILHDSNPEHIKLLEDAVMKWENR